MAVVTPRDIDEALAGSAELLAQARQKRHHIGARIQKFHQLIDRVARRRRGLPPQSLAEPAASVSEVRGAKRATRSDTLMND